MKHLPEGWQVESVGRLFEVQLGKMLNQRARKGNKKFPYLTNFNVLWGSFSLDRMNEMHFNAQERQKFLLESGDILMCEGGEIGRCAIWRGQLEQCYYQKALHRLRPITDQVLPEYLCLYMQSSRAQKELAELAGISSIAHLTREKLLRFPIFLPPVSEQTFLKDLFTEWDRAIETLQALIDAKTERKRGLMQQLLTGKKHLPGFSGDWKESQLGNFIKEVTRKTAKPEKPFLAAGVRSHCRGVFLKPDFAPEDIALSELFELRTGDLVVNITFAWEGAVAIVPSEANGALVSHRFPTFAFKDSACPAFFKHLVQTKRFRHECILASPGGAGRNRVLNKKVFRKIKVWCPNRSEQAAIAQILDTCDRELTLHHQQLQALREQKRGLMQKLLTGEVRVKT